MKAHPDGSRLGRGGNLIPELPSQLQTSLLSSACRLGWGHDNHLGRPQVMWNSGQEYVVGAVLAQSGVRHLTSVFIR